MLGVTFNNTFRYQNSNNPQNKKNMGFKGGFGTKTLEIKGKETSAKIFAKRIEEETAKQIKELCNLPFFKDSKIRIMPDVSYGNGCVVGFTAKIATDKIKELPPSIIGNDIGCGVLMVKTDAKLEDLDLAQVDNFIKVILPGNKKIKPEIPTELKQDIKSSCTLFERDEKKIFDQAGSLGGGNHFIEIDADENGYLYLAIHTGSRQFGSYIKEYYEKMQTKGYNCNDINYADAVAIAQKYAKFNRESIATMILEKFKIKPIMQFDCPHNYIADNGIIHKGSIDASINQPVLIPLNMRDGMILGTGKGNVDWNCSAPHGSGRSKSRADARKTLSLNEYVDSMRGIYSSCVGEKSIDEAPQAYKDSNEIIDLVQETITIDKIIKPVYNFKSTKYN